MTSFFLLVIRFAKAADMLNNSLRIPRAALWMLAVLLEHADGGVTSFQLLRAPALAPAGSPGTTGSSVSLGLQNLQNNAYYISVPVGTPAQTMLLQIDTGSAWTWIGSSQCQSAGNCNDANPFVAANSASFKDVSHGNQTTVSYSVGSVAGALSTDTFQVGNASVQHFSFVLASIENGIIQNQQAGAYDGVVGLALQGGVTSPAGSSPTLFQAMLAQNLLSEPVFSIALNPMDPSQAASTNTPADGGSILFGGTDPSLYTGDILQYPVVDAFFWSIALSSVSFNLSSRPALLQAPSGTTIMFDSGTSYTTLNQAFLDNTVMPILYAAAGVQAPTGQSAGFYRIPCDATLPDLVFDFGDAIPYKLAGALLVQPRGDADGACIVALGGSSGSMWILGEDFLGSHYAVFGASDGGWVGLASQVRRGLAFKGFSTRTAVSSATKTRAGLAH
ncbi:aspartic peptidase domain-containing protein [Chytriomyces sp. MP71]|nr:aspartic peptidase domain-containing protein [Chytriomyces sp. MP71]